MAGTYLLGVAGGVMASSTNHQITVDGWVLDSQAKEILSGEEYKAAWKYEGDYKSCTKVIDWRMTKPGSSQAVDLGSNGSSIDIQETQPGDYELIMTTEGYDGRWMFGLLGCDNSGEGIVDTSVNLNMEDTLYTDTKHPIMIVPGVIGYDRIELLGAEYLYGVSDAIMKTSNQHVEDVSLDPWLNTEERGAQLADRVVDYLIVNDENFGTAASEMKVNLLAHSHGSTTSRMAVRMLAQAFPGDQAKVASLTTVAGPHYGTPTADGAQWILENWEDGDGTFLGDGKTFIKTMMFMLGDFATLALNLTTGNFPLPNFYNTDGIYDTVEGFTQRGMARFNACYPSAGLQNIQDANYFLESNFPGKEHALKDSITVVNNEGEGTADIIISDCQNFAYDDHADWGWKWLFGDKATHTMLENFDESDQFNITKTVNTVETPNEAYGTGLGYAEYDAAADGVYGDGLGESKGNGDAGAIRYFSFTGEGEWNTTFGNGENGLAALDVADPIIGLFNAAHRLAGAKTTKNDWIKWRDDFFGNIAGGDPVPKEGTKEEVGTGYQGGSDAFIPVNSTRFGQYIGTFGPWNHMDEQNGLLGWVAKGAGADDPIAVYREHANRLKNSGL